MLLSGRGAGHRQLDSRDQRVYTPKADRKSGGSLSGYKGAAGESSQGLDSELWAAKACDCFVCLFVRCYLQILSCLGTEEKPLCMKKGVIMKNVEKYAENRGASKLISL